MKKDLILAGANIPGIRNWLSKEFGNKKNGNPFTNSDVQGYIKRKCLPINFGDYQIKEIRKEFSTPVYHIYKVT